MARGTHEAHEIQDKPVKIVGMTSWESHIWIATEDGRLLRYNTTDNSWFSVSVPAEDPEPKE